MKNPTYVLERIFREPPLLQDYLVAQYVNDYEKILKNLEQYPDFFSKLVELKLDFWDVRNVLFKFKDHHAFLHKLIESYTDLSVTIFSLKNLDLYLLIPAFEHFPTLLEDPNILEQLRRVDQSPSLINLLNHHPVLFEHLDCLTKILDLQNPSGILKSLTGHPSLIQTLTPERFMEIAKLPDGHLILSLLGDHPELIENLDVLKQVFDSKMTNASSIFLTLVRYRNLIQILTPERFLEIAKLPEGATIIELLGPLPLENLDILMKIVNLKYPVPILTVLQENPNLLTSTPEFFTKVLTLPNPQVILDVLAQYPKYLDQPYLLDEYKRIYDSFDGNVGDNFESLVFPYIIRRTEQVASQSSGPFINLSRVLKDLEAPEWNNLPIREGDISDEDWETLRENLQVKMIALFPENEHIKRLENALKWFDTMPTSRDAEVALQLVRKRVASIVDFINKANVDPEVLVNDAVVDEAVEIAKELVRIIAKGGTAFPDRAAIGLEEAETYAKAFGSNGAFMINIIVNDFKRNIIPAKFVDPTNKESIEAQLYHLNLLNQPLGLESATKDMLYPDTTKQTPLAQAMRISYEILTEENLIGFAQDHPLIQAQFRSDPSALEAFEQLVNDPKQGLGLQSTNLNLDTSIDLEENPDEYISRLKYLMVQALSIEALTNLKERFEADFWVRYSMYNNNPEKAKELDALSNQFDKMLINFKTEKTILLLKAHGFLSDTPKYQEIDPFYLRQ